MSGSSGARDALAHMVATAGTHRLLVARQHRLHLALIAVVAAVSVFAYLMLPSRTVKVQADGHEIVVDTYISDDHRLLGRIGIDLNDGDRVTALAGDGIDVLRVERARRVTLAVDGITYEMLTHARTIDQLLDEAKVATSGRDSVLQNGALVSFNAPVDPPVLFTTIDAFTSAPASETPILIEVRRAVPLTIVEDGAVVSETTSSRPTVAQALREAGIRVGPGDRVLPDAQASLAPDMRIEVQHARAMTVTLPQDHVVLYTFESTVGAALAAAGVSLPPDSYAEPSLDASVYDGMSVRVVQIAEEQEIEREYVENRTVYRSDPSLSPGQVRTVQGHDGVRVRRYAVGYVNGAESSRVLVDEYWESEPVDTVVYYPVQNGQHLAQPEGQVVKTLRVYATWYNPASAGRPASDPAYGRTATGVLVTYGVVAVDPTLIPLGTKMFIPGYGYGVAADTGGAVKGYIIDLGFPDGIDVNWTSRWLDIYILE